MKQLSRSKVI